jgi:hypothetical protein
MKNGESMIGIARTVKSSYDRLAIMDDWKQAFTFLDICLIAAVIISILLLPVIVNMFY